MLQDTERRAQILQNVSDNYIDTLASAHLQVVGAPDSKCFANDVESELDLFLDF